MTREEFLDRIKDKDTLINLILIDRIPEKVVLETKIMFKCPTHGKFHINAPTCLYKFPAIPCRECYMEKMRQRCK